MKARTKEQALQYLKLAYEHENYFDRIIDYAEQNDPRQVKTLKTSAGIAEDYRKDIAREAKEYFNASPAELQAAKQEGLAAGRQKADEEAKGKKWRDFEAEAIEQRINAEQKPQAADSKRVRETNNEKDRKPPKRGRDSARNRREKRGGGHNGRPHFNGPRGYVDESPLLPEEQAMRLPHEAKEAATALAALELGDGDKGPGVAPKKSDKGPTITV